MIILAICLGLGIFSAFGAHFYNILMDSFRTKTMLRDSKVLSNYIELLKIFDNFNSSGDDARKKISSMWIMPTEDTLNLIVFISVPNYSQLNHNQHITLTRLRIGTNTISSSFPHSVIIVVKTYKRWLYD